MSTGFVFFLFIWGMFLALIAAAFVVKLREIRMTRRWPAAAGKVLVSRIEAHKRKPGDIGYNQSDTNIVNYPLVEYEYRVNDKLFRSKRIDLDMTPSSFEMEARLTRFPAGAAVTVYYDPADPSRAVLERDWPPGIVWGGICAGLIFVGFPLIAIFGFTNATDWLAHHIANPGQASVVALVGGMGLVVVWFGLAYRKMIADACGWPVVRGRIIEAAMEEFRENASDSDAGGAYTAYKANVVYQYEVDGRSYAGDRLAIGVKMASNLPGVARRTLAKYPLGSEVDVHYNPQNPAESVLHPRTPAVYFVWLVAAGLFWLAWAIAVGKLA